MSVMSGVFFHTGRFFVIRFFSSFFLRKKIIINTFIASTMYGWLFTHNRFLDTEKQKTVFFHPIKCLAQRDKRNKEKWQKKNRNPWKNVSKTNSHIHSAASTSNSKKKWKRFFCLLFTIHWAQFINSDERKEKKSTMNIDTRMITIEFRTVRRNRAEIRFFSREK